MTTVIHDVTEDIRNRQHLTSDQRIYSLCIVRYFLWLFVAFLAAFVSRGEQAK